MIYEVEIQHPSNHSKYYVVAKDVAEAADAALRQDTELLAEEGKPLTDEDKQLVAVNRKVKSVREFAYRGQFVPTTTV